MVIVVGMALSVRLLGQLFTHLSVSFFCFLIRSALSDWHLPFMALFVTLVLLSF